MNNRNRMRLKDKNKLHDALTNKFIPSSKQVIAVENAIEWVKKEGCIVIEPKVMSLIFLALGVCALCLMNVAIGVNIL